MLALTLAALVWVSPVEQNLGPFSHRPGDPHAIAVSRDAMLLAWSEIDLTTSRSHIHIALLNHDARAIAPIRIVPLVNGAVDASQPEITSDGISFRVTYLEGWLWFAVEVDAAGVPSEPRSIAPRGSNSSSASASWHLTWIPSCHWNRWCWTGTWRYDLVWSAGGLTGVYETGSERVSGIATAAIDGRAVFAWRNLMSVNWLLSTGETFSIGTNADDLATPAIACNANDCVVAYGTRSGDVHAASFELAHPYRVLSFVVNASERREHTPQVHALPTGTFLVSYDSDAPYGYIDHRVGGRLVSVGPVKRRAAD